MKSRIVQVLLPLYQDKVVFDYSCDQDLQIGAIVVVSFRNKKLTGVVWSKDPTNVSEAKLKPVAHVIDGITLSSSQLKFIEFIANYTMSKLGAVLKLTLPFNLPVILSSSELCEGERRTQAKKNILSLDPSPFFAHSKEGFRMTEVELNPHQATSAAMIASHLGKYSCVVLEGVTGSGKTEVYIDAIAKVLEDPGSQVLVLLPEIMLTGQFVVKFQERFGFVPPVWHSRISQKERKQLWQSIATGQTRLVLGARSALFLPFKQLKLIVVDEEHDHSYKQEEGVIYNARDMAVSYSYINNSPIILASATPSIETMHNVSLGKYLHTSLPTRYMDAAMPDISIIDMKQARLQKGQWLSSPLRQKISAALAAGNQVMLFLNRKGYAPITLCRSCGYKDKCINCDSFMVMYKKKSLLICNHCGFSKEVSTNCPKCNSVDSLIKCGPGVEKIEEEVKDTWPDARTMVVTSEQTGKAEDIWERITSKQVDVIIGTQILSKGYHFPMLNLIGLVDADIGLIGADLRSSEKMYQLLHQISGRAGRESKGEVMIQTYFPDNLMISSVQNHTRKEFYTLELQARKLVNMPPFTRLVALILSGKDEAKLKQFAASMAKVRPYDGQVSVLGPAPAPIFKLRGKYRYRFLVRSALSVRPQNYIKAWLSLVKPLRSVTMKIDVDPYTLL